MKVTHIFICVLFVLMCGTCDGGFTATLPNGPNTGVAIYPCVKYSVILYVGIGYNPLTGVFTVPPGMAGTWLVSVTMMTGTVGGHTVIMRNGVIYVWLYTGNQYDMATQTVCMDLQVNDRVWVNMANGASTLFSEYNTFTMIKVLG